MLGIWLQNYARALLWRYSEKNDPSDLEDAIAALTEASSHFQQDSPTWASCQANLGEALLFKAAVSEQRTDLALALDAFMTGFSSMNIERDADDILTFACRLGSILAKSDQWDAAARVMATALKSAEFLYRGQTTGAARRGWLRHAKDLHALAAFVLAKANQPESAVLAIESGRARQLADALELDRAEIQALIDAGQTDLCERYLRCSEQLTRLAAVERASQSTTANPGLYQTSRRASEELSNVNSAIRSILGFEGFMKPPTIADLRDAARDSAIVYVVASELGGLMLLVTGAGSPIQSVWLPSLTVQDVSRHVSLWQKAYLSWRSSAGATRETWFSAIDQVTQWLWDSAGLGKLLTVARELKTLVLVPTGQLGYLPLHAGWCSDPSGSGGRRYFLDHFTVRYAPSGRTFSTALRLSTSAAPPSALIVCEPQPVHAAPLPGTKLEASVISALMSKSKRLEGEEATRQRVQEGVRDHTVQHFCCHAFANPTEPLAGDLLMSGDEVLTLRDILAVHLPWTRLTVLSACETEIAGEQLPDEVISLAAGFLQAGAAAVISSLWAVNDIATALLMARFYET